jgi:hypothetical protein
MTKREPKVFNVSHVSKGNHNVAQTTVILNQGGSESKALELFEKRMPERKATYICEKGKEEGGMKLDA